jgi:hypothetical protein
MEEPTWIITSVAELLSITVASCRSLSNKKFIKNIAGGKTIRGMLASGSKLLTEMITYFPL